MSSLLIINADIVNEGRRFESDVTLHKNPVRHNR